MGTQFRELQDFHNKTQEKLMSVEQEQYDKFPSCKSLTLLIDSRPLLQKHHPRLS